MQSLRDMFASMTNRQRWWLGGGTVVALVLFVVIVAVTGSGDQDPDPTSSTTTTTSAPPASTTSTTTPPSTTTSTATTTAANTRTWPLTGLADETNLPTPPILAVKIDNTTSGRPPSGLESADLVFDIPVEGGISRLLAFFQSRDSVEIGPVRSVREVDPKLVEPFRVLMAHSGGNAPIVSSIREVAIDVGHPELGTTAYRRAADRPAPYDLMLDPAAAVSSVDEATGLRRSWLLFGDLPPGQPARTVEIASSNLHQVAYGYSGADGGYLRFHGSEPHRVASGDQIVATNVVILVVEQLETGRVDRTGAPVPDFEVLGTGPAVVFREGVAQVGRWERGRLSDFFRFFDSAGTEMRLAPGTTWIHLIPEGRTYEWR